MRMIRPHECARKLAISRATLHRWRRRPGFPLPFRLGDNSVAFDEREIDEWLESRRASPFVEVANSSARRPGKAGR